MISKISKTLLILALVGCQYACDEVSVDDRYIELPPVTAARTVLLEEFTGQNCTNCPLAHDIIKDLLTADKFGNNLIVVSIHAGNDAISMGNEWEEYGIIGLRTEESSRYGTMHGITAFPAGVVNRKTGPLDKDDWYTAISDAVKVPTNVELSVNAELSAEENTAKIYTDITPWDNINANLQLWIVENGIMAMQLMPDASVKEDYIHNHVFRATVNGFDGEPVNLINREPESLEHSYTVSPKQVADNLEVVAFLYNDSQGVITSAKCKLTGKQ